MGVVAAGAPAGGVSPAEGVGDKDVDGVAGVVEPGDTWGVGDKLVVGAESLLGAATDAGEPPADERVCANAASGNSGKRAMAARRRSLGVSIELTMAVPGPGSTPSLVTIDRRFFGVHNLASRLPAAARECWVRWKPTLPARY